MERIGHKTMVGTEPHKILALAIFYMALLIPTFPVLGSETGKDPFVTEVIENAKKNTTRMSDKSKQIFILAEIAELEADLISRKAARKTLQKATDEVLSLQDVASRPDALQKIVAAYLHMNDHEGALNTAKSIDNMVIRIDILCEIALAQVKASDRRGAEKTLRSAFSALGSINPGFRKDFAASTMIHAQLKIDDLEGAMQTVETISTPDAKLVKFKDLAEYLKGKGKINEAKFKLRQAVAIATQLTDPGRKDKVASDLSKELSEIGDLEGALSSLSLITDKKELVPLVPYIMSAFAKAGKSGIARKSFVSQKDKPKSVGLLSQLALAQAKTGDKNGAVETIQQGLDAARSIDDDDERSQSYSDLAITQGTIGDTKGAVATASFIERDSLNR